MSLFYEFLNIFSTRVSYSEFYLYLIDYFEKATAAFINFHYSEMFRLFYFDWIPFNILPAVPLIKISLDRFNPVFILFQM